MRVQIGGKVYNGVGKPVIIYLTEEDKKFISEMEDREYIILSTIPENELEGWLKAHTLIPGYAVEKLKQIDNESEKK